jgi:hypothetical protein
MKLLAIPLLCLALPFACQEHAGARPVDVFAAWDGAWRGTFVSYDASGRELHRIAVEQTYRTLDDTTQAVTIRDTLADGTVVEGTGHNVAERAADGSLRLRCTVAKSNGERVEHAGRVVTGPTGRTELIWYSDSRDRTETFREWVDGATYAIHGMGRYGSALVLMAGAYSRSGSSDTSADPERRK